MHESPLSQVSTDPSEESLTTPCSLQGEEDDEGSCLEGCAHRNCDGTRCLIPLAAVSDFNPDNCCPTAAEGSSNLDMKAAADHHHHHHNHYHINGKHSHEHESHNHNHNHEHDHGPHKHGASCGHELVQHGDHVDFLVDSHLHHIHGDHCDDHGFVDLDSFLHFDFCECPGQHDLPFVISAAPQPVELGGSFPNLGESLPPASLLADDTNHTLTLQTSNCNNCQKKRLPVAHRTRLTEEALKRKAEVLADHISKLVKTKNQRNFTISSPVHHLKGVTTELSGKLKQVASELSIECSTIQHLAAVTDDQARAIQERDPQVFRNLKGILVNAKRLVENTDEEVSFRKRAKNAACCHRFREKKKQKLDTLETSFKELQTRCGLLTRRISELEQEKQALQALLFTQNQDPNVLQDNKHPQPQGSLVLPPLEQSPVQEAQKAHSSPMSFIV